VPNTGNLLNFACIAFYTQDGVVVIVVVGSMDAVACRVVVASVVVVALVLLLSLQLQPLSLPLRS